MRSVVSRAMRFVRSDGFRDEPIRSTVRRVRWHGHWSITPDRPFVVPFRGDLKLRLAHTSASSGVYLNGGFSDPAVAAAFAELLEPGMTVLDCGAHIGEYTVLFASLVGPEGEVHAFEPDERLFPVLEENVARNGLSGPVRLNRLALADQSGEARYALQEDPTASSLEEFAVDAPVRFAPVQTISLDRYAELHSIRRLDAVKIDVEGAEDAALAGATKLFRRTPPRHVFIECDRHDNVPAVVSRLEALGFQVNVDRAHLHPHVTATTD